MYRSDTRLDHAEQSRPKVRYLARKVRLVALFLVFWVVSPLYAANNKLLTVEPADSSVGETRLVFSFEQPVVAPRQFELSQPPRVVLDFADTLNELGESYLPYSTGVISGIRLAEAGNRTRVVINLTEAVNISTERDGKTITLIAKRHGDTDQGTSGKEQAHKSLSGIDFRRGDNGEGIVKLLLTDSSTVVDVSTRGQEVVLDLRDTEVPEDQLRLLDVIDFATPVRTIDVTRVGPDARVIITSLGKYEQTAYQIGDAFIVEIAEPPPAVETKISTESNKIYTGEKLSLNFQNIEIRAILQIIADFTGLNIVVSDSVTGNLTLRLKQVPWDHALDIILKTQGLAKRQKDNVILVAPSEEIAAREKLELESQKQIAELSPLVTEVIKLEFAEAQVVYDMFKEAAGDTKQEPTGTEDVPQAPTTNADDVSKDQGFLSPRGAIGFDERTNSLLIKDTRAKVDEIRQVLDIIDVPVAQVMVESRIVIASDSFSRDLGVQIGFGQEGTTNGVFKAIGGVGAGQRTFDADVNVPGFTTTDNQNQTLVDLPAANATSGIGLFLLKSNDFLLDLEITAAQLEGDAEVIASPRVITADRQPASISQGLEIPYVEVTGTGSNAQASINFKEALLKLDVTPQITPGDDVLMDLAVQRQDPNDARSVSGNPAIDTRSITSQVLVNDGDTVVLGGIYERTLSNAIRKVPFFGDLPIIGNLFKRTTKTDERNELLVFVQPTVLRKNTPVAETP